MTDEPRVSRAVYAAVLLTAALAALLVAWFLAGWADVRARQRAERAAPTVEAERRGNELAHQLRGELSVLLARELERPYFHYQNLFHDPRSSVGVSVTPSPLASAIEEPMVMGYFQLDADGKASTPTINDELPELSWSTRLAENRQFLGEVVRSLSGPLAPPPRAVQVAQVAVATPAPTKPPRVAPSPQQVQPPPQQAIDSSNGGDQAQQSATKQSKVVTIDPTSYAQNRVANTIYSKNYPNDENRPSKRAPKIDDPLADLTPSQSPSRSQATTPVPPAPSPSPPAPVTITVSPLEWKTFTFGGQPSLMAVRHVETPDGPLSQGFVIDRSALTSWLAARAGDAVVELRAGDGTAAEIATGWHLAVTANPRAVTAAAASAAQISRGFVIRFSIVGVIAALAAGMVVLLVARAERLARERSQFAAAAAHELRTPLAGLQLYGDMLADGLGDPAKVNDYAKRMSEEASRLGRVVSNVLGFSQLERGNLSVDPHEGPLGKALAEIAERVQPTLDRAGAALDLDVDPDLTASFDRDALARIIGNLLDNAEKYGRGASDRTIGLTARRAGDRVEVAISDHGPGVAQSARSQLFRPFSRGVASDGPAGLGLGLALSQSLARAMGGDLEYRGTRDGATFVLILDAVLEGP